MGTRRTMLVFGRFTWIVGAFWLALFAFTSLLTIHAARHWKFPEYPARHYWASRLTGSPQAFLGSDQQWHYFGLKGMFLHGWEVGRVSREAAERGRDAGVRAHVDELILSADDKTAELREFTGLSFDNQEAWVSWWRQNRKAWSWPIGQEQLWESRVLARGAESPDAAAPRAWYMKEISSVKRKAAAEIIFFALWLLLIWPVGPLALRALWSHCDRYRFAAALGLALVSALVLYTAAVFPHLQWGYGLGASTTLSGPGFLTFSGPYTFHLHYKPGDTIIYRQFLELIFDPAVRLARAGLLSWLPPVPLALVAPLPYVAMALIIGTTVGLRDKLRHRPA